MLSQILIAPILIHCFFHNILYELFIYNLSVDIYNRGERLLFIIVFSFFFSIYISFPCLFSFIWLWGRVIFYIQNISIQQLFRLIYEISVNVSHFLWLVLLLLLLLLLLLYNVRLIIWRVHISWGFLVAIQLLWLWLWLWLWFRCLT